jgi:hypothetical protein
VVGDSLRDASRRRNGISYLCSTHQGGAPLSVSVTGSSMGKFFINDRVQIFININNKDGNLSDNPNVLLAI